MLLSQSSDFFEPRVSNGIECVEEYISMLELYMGEIRKGTVRYRAFEETRNVVHEAVHLLKNGASERELCKCVEKFNKTSFNKMFPQSSFPKDFRKNLFSALISSILMCK